MATVGDIERMLFEAFAAADAEDWDNPGLAVGDRCAPARRIALALDMDCETVVAAAEAGCDVLVSHHPAFIKDGPDEFGPALQEATAGPGRMVYEASARGLATIAMHTNADRAVSTREHFAALLDMDCEGNFECLMNPARTSAGTGFGAVLSSREPLSLEELVVRCKSALGGMPRVWGDSNRPVTKVAFLNGSWSEAALYRTCIEAGIECMVVGETRYHLCVDAQPYLSVVELGHDISELPLVDVLKDALLSRGVAAGDIVDMRCGGHWWCPSS